MLLDKLIEIAKGGNQDAMLQIIEKFQPILRKYTHMSNYSEDVYSELVLNLIELVHKIDLKKFGFINDYVLISYINTALYHSYIRITKRRSLNMRNEQLVDDISSLEQISLIPSVPNFASDIVLKDFLVTVLSPREYFCVDSIVFRGETASSVASKLGISRQAVNQSKKRALKKLGKLL